MERNFIKNIRRELVFGLILFSLVMLHSGFVSANFACGQVWDSEDNMSAQWYNVDIFYEQSGNHSSCQISPAANKYCCDSESVDGNLKIGETIFSEIFDNETGYFAGPVASVTSGEGYDVLPEMKLKKAIQVHNLKRVVFSDENKLFLNASFETPYTFIELERENNKSILCTNCSEFSDYIDLNWGSNRLKIIASSFRSFSENIIVSLLEGFDFRRDIKCEKCEKNIVKSDQIVEMILNVNLSHEVEGLELKEYVPSSWEIIETDGKVEEYSETHNLVSWNISGKNIVKSYRIKAPGIIFFPRQFIFKTELEEELLNEDKIIVSRFFSFFSFKKDFEFKTVKKTVYSRISSERPLVLRTRNKNLTRIAIFPKETIKNAEFSLGEYEGERIEDFEPIGYYSFETNLDPEDIEKIFVEFKVRKQVLEEYENISLFVFKDSWEQWTDSEIEPYDEDEDYVYYNVFLDATKSIALVGREEPGFFNSLIDVFG